jgi:hypothetical protein
MQSKESDSGGSGFDHPPGEDSDSVEYWSIVKFSNRKSFSILFLHYSITPVLQDKPVPSYRHRRGVVVGNVKFRRTIKTRRISNG